MIFTTLSFLQLIHGLFLCEETMSVRLYAQQQLIYPSAAIGKRSLCFQISVKTVKIVLQSGIARSLTKTIYYYEACVPPAFLGLIRVHENFAIIKYL